MLSSASLWVEPDQLIFTARFWIFSTGRGKYSGIGFRIRQLRIRSSAGLIMIQ